MYSSGLHRQQELGELSSWGSRLLDLLVRIRSRGGLDWQPTKLLCHLTWQNLHNVFHVSQLRKYIADPTHVLEQDDVQVREDLTVGVEPVRILDSQVKQLGGKEIRTVKVLWDEATQEMTKEMEDLMGKSYPRLFPSKSNFRGRKFYKVGKM